jgi:glycosyltransferase involved in cell wall biosynthesis
MELERIAYVVSIFPEVSETFIATELAEVMRRGVQVKILSGRDPQRSVRHSIVTDAGLDRLVTYDREQYLPVLQEFRPQLIHAHFATAATAIAREMATRLGVPYTFTAHGYDIFYKPPHDFGERAMQAAAVVTVSEANVKYIEAHFGVPRSHITRIPCGINTERFSPASEKLDPLHIVCVARLAPVKNHFLLLQACLQLQSRNVRFHCVLLGDGVMRDTVLTERTRLGLENVVTMPGAVDQEEVRTWLRKAAVAVLPSHSEGMPVSLMEAAACGIPVVATPVGGIPELVADGETGYLTPLSDAVAMADALQKLLLSPELRERLGRAARARAVERFSVLHQVDLLMAVWIDVLARRDRSGTVIERDAEISTAEIRHNESG